MSFNEFFCDVDPKKLYIHSYLNNLFIIPMADRAELAQEIYTQSLVIANFINNHIVKENLSIDTINEVQSQVEACL